MKINIKFVLIVLIISFFAIVPVSAVNVVTNPSAVNGYVGWTVTTNNGGINGTYHGAGDPDNDQYNWQITTSGTYPCTVQMAQIVDFTNCKNISFYMAGNGDPTSYMNCLIDSSIVATILGNTGSGMHFYNYDLSYSGTHTLKFYFYMNSGSAFYFDDINMSSSIISPIASFTASPTSGNAPLSVTFTDNSTNTPTSWSWDFGDGTTSTSQNPSHQYTNGTFNVSLTATNAGGSNTTVKYNYINVGNFSGNSGGSGSPYTMFTGSPRIGIVPFTVTFTNQGSNYTGSYWTFGDGGTSSTTSPTHSYTTAGYYYVSLNNSNSNGWNNLTGFNYIWAFDPVTSAFTANKTSIAAGEYVSFTDTSIGTADTWKWYVNGVQVSTAANLVYQFPAAGTYSIQHYAANSLDSSSDWENKTNYIYAAQAAPNCDFTSNVTYGNSPLDVKLTDTSTGNPSSFTWGINGVYQTNTQDMSVTFNTPGFYSINHTAANAIGTNSKTKTNYIQVYAPNYGGIYGYIIDADKNTTISGASCQMTNLTATANIVSDSEGFYYFWPVYNGVYNLSVSKNGYAIASFPNTIINGTTTRQDIYLTSYSDNVNETNISNYSSDWLRYNLVSNPSTKTMTLTYSVIKGTTAFANCTIYDDLTQVYTNNITSQTNTFSFTGSPNKNYLVSFDIMNSEGNRFSGAFPVLFYRGFPGNNPIFPPGTPQGIINGIIVFVIIACFAFFGKAYLEIGMFLGLGVMVSSYIWGFLNFPDTIHIEVIIFLTALIAGGAYITKKKILGW